MPAYILKDSKLWLDGYDFSGYMNRIGITASVDLKGADVFAGQTGRKRLAGHRDGQLRARGFWEATNAVTNEPDKPIFDRLSIAQVPITCAPQDGNEGSIAYFMRGAHGLYRPGEAAGEVLAFEVEASTDDGIGVVRGTLLANKNVAAGAGVNGTAFQVGAVSATQKLYAALHVLGVGTSVDVRIESDTVGFPSPVTRITFAQKVAIGSEYAAPVAGPNTDDYWRIVYTTVGAPNARFVVVMGIM